jgi:hypothetical protein
MSAHAAEVCGRFLWEGDTSSMPFEWTGHLQPSAAPPQAPCLPLRGSVQRIGKSGRELAAVAPESLGMKWSCWDQNSKVGQARL